MAKPTDDEFRLTMLNAARVQLEALQVLLATMPPHPADAIVDEARTHVDSTRTEVAALAARFYE